MVAVCNSFPRSTPLALAGFAGCVKKFDYSDKDAVIPDSTQMLGYKPPKYYGIGTSARSGPVTASKLAMPCALALPPCQCPGYVLNIRSV